MHLKTIPFALICLSLLAPLRADDDALPIIRKAFEAARKNEALARQYVYRERIDERRFDRKGREKKRESTIHDVTLLDGSEYRRLIAVNDRPLTPEGEAKEQRKLAKRLREMREETPKQRSKRQARIERGRREGEQFLEEITKAFDFRLTGEEVIDGVPVWVVSAEPRPDYRPTGRETKVLPKVRATLWVSQMDHAWVQADIEVFENVRWAVVFKLRKGARIRFKQRRIDDEVWMTESWTVRLRARVALVYGFNGEIHGSYSDFRKFTTEAQEILGPAASP